MPSFIAVHGSEDDILGCLTDSTLRNVVVMQSRSYERDAVCFRGGRALAHVSVLVKPVLILALCARGLGGSVRW